MFQTVAYDIKFGFYRAKDAESVFTIENEGEDNEIVKVPCETMEVVYPMSLIESSESLVKVTFIAKEPGYYKIVFSNEHSWMRSKTLKMRYVVLKPVVHN